MTQTAPRFRPLLIACLILLTAILAAAIPCLADDGRELLVAARNGDLATVKRLLAAGTPVDSPGAYGTTALSLAAQHGRIEVLRLLLEKGADPDAREGFFGMSALDMALWKGAPEFEAARMLLAAGAGGRAGALNTAVEAGNVELARAAVGSGPVTESEAAALRERHAGLEGPFAELLAELLGKLQTIPDPPPPSYSAEELATFAGAFEGQAGALRVEATDKGLVLVRGDTRTPLQASAEREFRDEARSLTLRYFGRAGTVEGISLDTGSGDAQRMRVADSPVVSAAELPEFIVDPDAEPTVHWPGFRGKNRDGIGDGADTPVTFDLESGKNVAWIAELPGLGNSSPVVWGDKVFVTTAVAEGGSTPLRTGLTGAGDEIEENVEHRWMVLAYDKQSGKKLWETEVGRGVPLTKRHFKATQANSSPVTDGEHLVVVFPTAGLACLGLDGKLHWKHELGGLNAGGFNDPGMQWGFAASPILHDGKVILQVDIHEGAYLAAWDAKSGELRWKTERPDVAPSWSTPAIWSTPKGDELVVNASVIRGYDPDDGKPLWSLGPTSIQVVAAPVIGGEHAYVSSGYPPARPIYAVKPGIRGDHTIEPGADSGALLAWHQARGGAYMPTPLLYRGIYYVVHHNGRIAGHDARSGEIVYRGRFSRGGTNTASPVAANGKLYQGTEEGTLYVLEAGPAHKELAVHEFEEPLMATPAISEGKLIVRTPSRLIVLEQKR